LRWNPLSHYALAPAQDLHLGQVGGGDAEVERSLERREAQLLPELVLVPLLVDIVLSFAHASGDSSPEQQVVPQLEDLLVLRILRAEDVQPLLCDLDALLPCSQVPLDETFLQQFQDALGRRLAD